MAPSQRLSLAAILLLAATAGCLGSSSPDAGAAGGAPGDGTAGQAPGSDPGNATGDDAPTPTPGPGVVARSSPDVPVLGLAVYDGIPRERVAPYTPGNMTPIPCFRTQDHGYVDLYLVVSEEHHPSLPGVGKASARYLSLLGCAQRPDGTAWSQANEPPWVVLMGWNDGDGYRRFLGAHGFPNDGGTVSLETQPGGYAFQASTDDGETVASGRFVTAGVGAPGFLRCEDRSFVGRAIQRGPAGLVALDWNKTEAVCPADATVRWPPGSPLADVLGPSHAASYAVDTRVEDAGYTYRVLAGP